MEESKNLSDAGKEFSFHRSPIDSSNRQNTSFNQSIRITLSKLPHTTLVDMCLDSFDENEFLRSEHFKISNQSITQTAEIEQLKQKVEKKRDTVRIMVENHNKLANMFEQHMKICSREEIKHEEYWEKKFKQLQHYMNEYVTQSNEIQDQYLKGFNRLKDENQRVYIEVSNLNRKLKESDTKESRLQIRQNHCLNNLNTNHGEVYQFENQKLKKQIEKFNQQKQRLEIDITSLYNDLEVLREKVKCLEIENASMKAQLYLKNDLISFQIQSPSEQGYANQYKEYNKSYDRNDERSRKKNILIPPLKIQESLQRIKQIQRSHSATYF